MARPTSRKKSKVSRAVCDLRAKLNDSQQAFSNRMGVALHTISRYETFAPPTGEALKKLAKVADQHELSQLRDFFLAQYVEEVLGDLKARLLMVPGELSQPPHGFLIWNPRGDRELRCAQICNLVFAATRSTNPEISRKADEGFTALEKVARECTGNPIVHDIQDAFRIALSGAPIEPATISKKPKPSPRKKVR
jgi:transcriptional regulator with XRE-family HTH domain